MKAVLLAAGLGTRLRPRTNTVSECLVEVGGRTLLDIWLDAFAVAGVEQVLVNTHHLPDRVEAHLALRDGAPPSVRTVQEPELLGSAGTLLANRHLFEEEELLIAVNADNLTDFDLRELIEAHRREDTMATITVFRAPDPNSLRHPGGV